MDILKVISDKQEYRKIGEQTMADELGISKVTWWKIKTGRQELRLSDLKKICSVLNCNFILKVFLGEEELILLDK